MQSLHVETRGKRQFVDITDMLETYLDSNNEGLLSIFVQHTTAAVTTADLDPGTDKDFLDFLEAITPNLSWRHPHDPSHAPDHLLASLLGSTISVPYAHGKLALGTWQRIILVEFDGPRSRQLLIQNIKI